MGEYLNISAEDNPWKITCPNVPFTCLKYIKPMQLMWKSEICSRPSDKSCRYCTSPTVICTRLRRSDKWNYEPCASKWVPEPFGQASLRDWELLHVGKHALWQLSSGSVQYASKYLIALPRAWCKRPCTPSTIISVHSATAVITDLGLRFLWSNQVGASPIFSGHVRVNQWSDIFGRGPIFSGHRSWNVWWWFWKLRWAHNTFFVVFNVILIIKTTFNAHNN